MLVNNTENRKIERLRRLENAENLRGIKYSYFFSILYSIQIFKTLKYFWIILSLNYYRWGGGGGGGGGQWKIFEVA